MIIDEAEGVPRRERAWPSWGAILKTVLGLGLLAALLLWQDNGRKLLDVLAGFQPSYLVALFAIAFLLVGWSVLKWRLFLQVKDVATVSYSRLFQLYLIGMFFNNFVPSSVGGDVVRIYLLGRYVNSQSRSAASVLLERATGVYAMVALATLFALLNRHIVPHPIVVATIAGAASMCAVALVLFYQPAWTAVVLEELARVPGLAGICARLATLAADIDHFRPQGRLLVAALGYSVIFHLTAALNIYVTCLAIGVTPSPLDILTVAPVILILSMVPVSPSNIGWWEWCHSVLLLDAGATAAQGLAVALTIRAIAMVVSLLGGLLFLQYRTQPAA